MKLLLHIRDCQKGKISLTVYRVEVYLVVFTTPLLTLPVISVSNFWLSIDEIFQSKVLDSPFWSIVHLFVPNTVYITNRISRTTDHNFLKSIAEYGLRGVWK